MGTIYVQNRQEIDSPSARYTFLWVLVCALLVVGSTFLPYLYAYANTPSGMQFEGILVLPQDLYGYLAKMQLGAHGEWLFRLSYTSEDHDGALLSIFYLALGRLSAAMGLPLILTFHLARLTTGVFLLASVFYAALAIFRRRDYAWAGLAIVGLSSGAGWLTILFGHLPADMLIPEATTYYAIFDNPHFPLAMGLLALTFLALLRAVEQHKARYAVAAALLTLAQVFLQPFLVITVYAVSTIWLICRWIGLRRMIRQEAGYLALIIGLPIPALAYDYAALYLNPVLRQWSAQNLTPSPPPYDFLLGYGLLGLLAALGSVYLWRSEKPLFVSTECRQLLLVWLVATIVLLYVPFGLQRRLVAGLHIALSLLAVTGFYGYIAPRLQAARRRSVLTILLVAMVPSNLFLLTFTALGAGDNPYPLYLKDGEVTAIRWLAGNTPVADTVLASDQTGNIIPGLAGNRVFYGHPFETIKAGEKKALLDGFFAGRMSESEERSLLREYGIALVYYGRSEREMGAFDPARRAYLQSVFNNADVAIYRVAGD